MEPAWFSDQTGLNIFDFGSDFAEQGVQIYYIFQNILNVGLPWLE